MLFFQYSSLCVHQCSSHLRSTCCFHFRKHSPGIRKYQRVRPRPIRRSVATCARSHLYYRCGSTQQRESCRERKREGTNRPKLASPFGHSTVTPKSNFHWDGNHRTSIRIRRYPERFVRSRPPVAPTATRQQENPPAIIIMANSRTSAAPSTFFPPFQCSFLWALLFFLVSLQYVLFQLLILSDLYLVRTQILKSLLQREGANFNCLNLIALV